jgi:hypothetical protein
MRHDRSSELLHLFGMRKERMTVEATHPKLDHHSNNGAWLLRSGAETDSLCPCLRSPDESAPIHYESKTHIVIVVHEGQFRQEAVVGQFEPVAVT